MHYDVNYNGSLKEEKSRLVNAVEQFREITIEVREINSLAQSL